MTERIEMSTVDIFGEKPITFNKFYGKNEIFLEEKDSGFRRLKTIKAWWFLNGNAKYWLFPPEEPVLDKSAEDGSGDISTPQDFDLYSALLEARENWMCPFEGGWRIKGKCLEYRVDDKSLWEEAWILESELNDMLVDDFIRESNKNNIQLTFDPKYILK